MSSAAVSSHSGTGSLSLMSCVRESSPLQDYECDTEKIGNNLIILKDTLFSIYKKIRVYNLGK